MGAPRLWNVASGSTALTSPVAFSYVDGLWLQTNEDSTSTRVLQVYYSSSVTGPWSLATPYTPVGADSINSLATDVAYDGTHFAAVMSGVIDGVDVEDSAWVVYTTDVAGSWSKISAATGTVVASPFEAISYFAQTIAYADGYWVIAGHRNRFTAGAVFTPFIAYATSVTGTWTVVNDPAGTGEGRGFHIGYAGGKWIFPIYDDFSTYSQLRVFTASTPGGTWTECSSFPTCYAQTNYAGAVDTPIRSVNGHAAFAASNRYGSTALSDDPDNRLFYASDPTGTWSEVTPTDLGYSSYTVSGGPLTGDSLADVAYVGGQWVIHASTSTFYGSQASGLAVSTSPAGPYTKITDSDLALMDYGRIALSPTRVAVGSWYVYWADLATRTFLRQRQSPVRSPSRVAPPNLRARQTTYIT